MNADIVGFLLARLREDEDVARRAGMVAKSRTWGIRSNMASSQVHVPADRMLSDLEAKWLVVELHDGEHVCPSGIGEGCTDFGGRDEWSRTCPTLAALAIPYSSHPDYREEWRP